VAYWTCGSGRLELQMTKAQAHSASHSGRCDDDVAVLMREPRIARQLAKMDEATVKAELREYGAWDDDELSDHGTNLSRIVWLAAGDIVDGNT
jgi:hypothetical protein